MFASDRRAKLLRFGYDQRAMSEKSVLSRIANYSYQPNCFVEPRRELVLVRGGIFAFPSTVHAYPSKGLHRSVSLGNGAAHRRAQHMPCSVKNMS